MPTYIALINWTEQGLRNIKAGPQRLDAVREAFRAVGGDVPEVYLVLGPFDAVAICDAPDDETYARLVLEIVSQGEVRTTTLKAVGEPRRLLASLP